MNSSFDLSGQPKQVKGRSADENQVSRTSESCLTEILLKSSHLNFFDAFSFASSSFFAAIQWSLFASSGLSKIPFIVTK